MLTDTHTHLYWESFREDFENMVQRAVSAGVSTIINVGVDVEKSKLALEQVQGELFKFSGLSSYSTIGIHPHEATKYISNVSIHEDINKLKEVYQKGSEKVVAIGECGLDFLFESNPDWVPNSLSSDQVKQLQRKLFQAQIDLAKELNLPLIVHCRDDRSKSPENSEAWKEVIEMTKDHFGIYHCYSGLSLTTDLVLSSTNFLISFAATITYPKNEYLREAARIIPLDRIVLETDCPFLPPQSKRGIRNEPANVLEIAQTLAEVKGISQEEVATQTTKNVKIILRLRSE